MATMTTTSIPARTGWAVLAVALLFSLTLPSHAEEGWLVSFEKAKAAAAKEGKAIFMEFTGSDWCPPCIALQKNVLSKDAFKQEMPKHFILLKLDSPRDKSKQTPEEIAQYKKLSTEYAVRGVPTIYLADATGKPFAKRVGYGSTVSAEDYVKDMVAKGAILKQRDEAIAKTVTTKGVPRARLLDEALSKIEAEIVSAHYGDLIAEIIPLDAKDEAGLKTKYEAGQKAAVTKAALQAIIRPPIGANAAAKPAEQIAKIDQLLATNKPDGEALQEMLFHKGQLLMRDNKKDEARKVLQAAKKAAPDSAMAPRIDQLIQQLFDPKRAL